MTSRIALLFAGVSNVKLRLFALRLGGDGGFTKAGDRMFGRVSAFAAFSGRLVVDAARALCRVVSTARFFKFLPFRGGGCFCSSKKGEV